MPNKNDLARGWGERLHDSKRLKCLKIDWPLGTGGLHVCTAHISGHVGAFTGTLKLSQFQFADVGRSDSILCLDISLHITKVGCDLDEDVSAPW